MSRVFGGSNHQLTRGVYTFGSSVTIEGGITFKGSDTEIFIIQIAGDMLQVAGTIMTLEGGALAKNIFWQIAGQVQVGADAQMKGILLVKTAVTFEGGSSRPRLDADEMQSRPGTDHPTPF
jgi:hypothetical protein